MNRSASMLSFLENKTSEVGSEAFDSEKVIGIADIIKEHIETIFEKRSPQLKRRQFLHIHLLEENA